MRVQIIIKSALVLVGGAVLLVARGWQAAPWVAIAALLMVYMLRDVFRDHG
jgi:hypothetical protein